MNSSSPRVALVGCGGIARAHLSVIPAAHIVALCDQNPEAAHRLSADFGLNAPVFTALEAALQAQNPDAVVICTPPTTHFDLACLALESNADVLCEKPLATSASAARALVEIAQSHQRTLRTSAKYRFCAGAVAARSLVDSGETGALQNLRIAFGSPFDYAHSWHSNFALSGGGVWMDNGPHALDLARYFAGELRLSSINEWHTDKGLETEGRACFHSDIGVHVEIALSWNRFLGDCFALLECENGTLEIGWHQTSWHPYEGCTRTLAGGYDKTECFAAQWQGFLSGDTRFVLEDGIHSLELIESLYHAALT